MNIYYDVEDNHYRTYPDGDIATIDQMRELIENKNLSIAKLQQENKQIKEIYKDLFNTYQKLKKENEEVTLLNLHQVNKIQKLKDKLSKIETLIINHNCDTGDIYYKYNSRFLKSELKQRILEIVYEQGSENK